MFPWARSYNSLGLNALALTTQNRHNTSMRNYVTLLVICCTALGLHAQGGGKYVLKNAQKALGRPGQWKNIKYVPRNSSLSAQLERAALQASQTLSHTPVQTVTASATAPAASASVPTARSGYLYVGLPFPGTEAFPKRNPFHKRYPSGLLQEEELINDWLEYFKNGYFQPRDQVEAIEGMTPRKMNNIIEYLYYMGLDEAKEIILNPLRDTGRLPDFMYNDKLIPGTQRLPSGYYKNKFNQNIDTFVKLAEEDGSIYTHNAQLKELMSAMKDYTFKQGFAYTNSAQLANGLRKNWEAMYAEISKPGVTGTNRALINQLWQKPVKLADGQTVSLKDYFTQRRKTAFFEAATPEFYLNSPKWVALENERRNLIAREYPVRADQANWFNTLQKRWVLGNPDKYLTLHQFAELMTAPYKDAYGQVRADNLKQVAVSTEDDPFSAQEQTPTSTTVKVNNFDKLGGVCCQSFTDGGYMGRVPQGYDGTSTVARFEPVVFEQVPVITFDMLTLQPRVVTLNQVSYVKDLKQHDIDQVRASRMVADGLDASRDVLSVGRAEKALRDIPHLRATVHPQGRVAGYEDIPYMKGGGLAAYLALFTPDFYPLKKVRLLQQVDGKWQWVPTYFVRKEVLTHAGFVHRAHLTFTEQVQDRIVPEAEK